MVIILFFFKKYDQYDGPLEVQMRICVYLWQCYCCFLNACSDDDFVGQGSGGLIQSIYLIIKTINMILYDSANKKLKVKLV